MNKIWSFLVKINLDYVLFTIFVIEGIVKRDKINNLHWIAVFCGFILLRLNKIYHDMK